jgi:hypothetical protein
MELTMIGIAFFAGLAAGFTLARWIDAREPDDEYDPDEYAPRPDDDR